MTPAAIIALVRDVAILAALIFIIWWIRASGENAVKLADIQAVQKQLAAQAAQQAQWAQEARDAEFQRTQDMQTVTATIGRQRAPILLQSAAQPSCSHPVPAVPASPSNDTAGTGGIISGVGTDSQPRDIRNAINTDEIRVEQAIADCRLLQRSWPH